MQFLDEDIVNWQGGEEAAKAKIKRILKSDTDFIWVILVSGAKTGFIGLENFKEDSAELWYLLDRQFQHQGIIRSTVRLLAKFIANLGLFSELRANVKIANQRSINLLEDIGFEIESKDHSRIYLKKKLIKKSE